VKYPFFCGRAWGPDGELMPYRGMWFRIFGWGLHVSTKRREDALFSERYGYTKVLYLFGLRFAALAP
jgi:hypothetical protein